MKHVFSILCIHLFIAYQDRTYTAKGGAIDIRESTFLTRGYARAYHELLQGLGYAN